MSIKKFLSKKLVAIPAMFVSVLLVSSPLTAQPTLPSDALLEAGVLHMGADFAAAPNQFIDDTGKKDGLNVDMCGEVAKQLGLTLKWTNLSFPGLVPGLQAKRYDGLCTAIFINPKRKEIMQMVAYVQWGEGLMTRSSGSLNVDCAPTIGNKSSYDACFDQLSGKRISVAAGGTTNRHLIEENDRMSAAGKAKMEIRAFDTNADSIQALASKQVDAVYANDPQAAFYMNRNPGYEMPFAAAYPNTLALATLKANRALAEALQWALEQMKSDGTYQTIVKKWGVAGVSEFVINP